MDMTDSISERHIALVHITLEHADPEVCKTSHFLPEFFIRCSGLIHGDKFVCKISCSGVTAVLVFILTKGICLSPISSVS